MAPVNRQTGGRPGNDGMTMLPQLRHSNHYVDEALISGAYC